VALRRDTTGVTPSPVAPSTARASMVATPATAPVGRGEPRGTNRLRPRVEPTFGRHSA
jgi:hypothetical protein